MSLFFTIDIRFADPISAIGMNDNFIIVGSMMGRIALLNLANKKCGLLSELSSENISGIVFEDTVSSSLTDICYISIGDEEVLRYKLDKEGNNHILNRSGNYDNDINHRNKCENIYCLLSKTSLLMIELNQQVDNGNININLLSNILKIKNNQNDIIYDYEVSMTNYSIPFDYDGERFLWIEFLNEKERNICMFNFNTQEKWEYRLDKSYGHVSFCRMINENQVLIIIKMNLIEIREMNSEFKLIHSYKNIGEEVIAIDFYYLNESIHNHDINNDKGYIKSKINKDDKERVGSSNEADLMKRKNIEEEKEERDERDFNKIHNNTLEIKNIPLILILDIDGNVNFIYNYQKVVTGFNLYKIKDIPQDIKDKQFFSMGYPYYIKSNDNFIVISSDFGVFVLRNTIIKNIK